MQTKKIHERSSNRREKNHKIKCIESSDRHYRSQKDIIINIEHVNGSKVPVTSETFLGKNKSTELTKQRGRSLLVTLKLQYSSIAKFTSSCKLASAALGAPPAEETNRTRAAAAAAAAILLGCHCAAAAAARRDTMLLSGGTPSRRTPFYTGRGTGSPIHSLSISEGGGSGGGCSTILISMQVGGGRRYT